MGFGLWVMSYGFGVMGCGCRNSQFALLSMPEIR